jgi:hypothetical protein
MTSEERYTNECRKRVEKDKRDLPMGEEKDGVHLHTR